MPAEFGVVAEGPADLLHQGPADTAAEGVELPAAAAVFDVEGEDALPPEQWRQALLGGSDQYTTGSKMETAPRRPRPSTAPHVRPVMAFLSVSTSAGRAVEAAL